MSHSISFDFFCHNKIPAIHVLDDRAIFRASIVLKSEKASYIWLLFVACLVDVYVGYPRRIQSKRESVVKYDLFKALATYYGIKLKFIFEASHNSMGNVEKSHAPLII